MDKLIRIGVDTSKSVFVLHGVNASEQPVLRRKLRRRQVLEFFAKLEPTKIGLEACGAAHYWARELQALGHEALLLPPQYVKPYVKRNKNDAADAEAICEAMSRPSMRFVPVKTAEQQAALMLAGTRDALIRRRTQVSNMIRGYAAEFGLTAAKGLDKIEPLVVRIAANAELPELAKELFAAHGQEYAQLQLQVREIEAKLLAWHKHNEPSRRLAEVPSIGPIGASLLVMKVPDPHAFRCGRDFSAWIGLTPKDHSTAGKKRLGVIQLDSRAGTVVFLPRDLELLSVIGGQAALAVKNAMLVRQVRTSVEMARIAWKLMVSGERYNPARVRVVPPPGRVAPRARRQGRVAPPAAVACGQP